jgi:hypothetical protein
MGAETTVYVRVLKTHEEWIEVSAVTLADAELKAWQQKGVAEVLETSYERPSPLNGADQV